LWGDGPAVGVGALFDVGSGTGVEFPGFGFESGESNELMSMMVEFEEGGNLRHVQVKGKEE
jgi:hypothetical protein